VLCPIGRGSSGQVWLARNVMGTYRAVKVVYRKSFDSDRPYDREFTGIKKFEPISRSHEGFVDILQVGRNDVDGYFYYVMELADRADGVTSHQGSATREQPPATAVSPGKATAQDTEHWTPNSYSPKTLHSEIKKSGRLPVEECLQLALSLSSALGQLHKHGLVHRDIKPSNIIFVDGQPKLADIGLVASVTEARSFVGTEGFIPPEGPGTRQADLYSLGKVLYEMSTGKDRTDFPELPTLVRELPEREQLMEFNEVLLKASHNNPECRYQSAEEMHADLALLRGGKSIRRLHLVERRLAIITKLGFLAVATAALTVGAYFIQDARRQAAEERRQQAEQLRERAQKAEKDAKEKLWESYLAQARANRWSGRAGRRFDSLEVLAEAARMRPDLSLRNEAIACMTLPDMRPKQTWDAFPTGTAGVAFGHKVERYARSDQNGDISIRRVSDDSEIALLPGKGRPFWVLRFSEDDEMLAVKDEPGGFYVWDLARQKKLMSGSHAVGGSGLCFSSDGRAIAVADHGGSIYLYEAASGVRLQSLEAGPIPNCLAFDPTDRYLAVSSQQTPQVHLRDLSTGQLVARLQTFPGGVSGIAWREDGKLLACACGDHQIYVVEVDDPATADRKKPTLVLQGHTSSAQQVAFSHDGTLLASWGWDAAVRLWDAFDGHQLVSVSGSWLGHFSADDRRFIVRAGAKAALCDVATAREYRVLRSTGDVSLGPGHADFSPDGRLLASAHSDGVRLWDLTTARLLAFLSTGETRSINFDPAGTSLFVCAKKQLTRWPIHSHRQQTETIWRFGPPEPLVERKDQSFLWASLSCDGRALAVVGETPDRVTVHDLKNGGSTFLLEGHPSAHCVTGSPDGQWIASYQWPYPTVRVSEVRNGKVVATFANSYGKPAFSRDSKWLLSGTLDEYSLWQVGSWKLERRIAKESGGNGPVSAFSHDGRVLAIEHSQRTLKLLDIAKGFEELATLEMPEPMQFSWLAFSPDDAVLAAPDGTHQIHLWDLRLIRQQLASMKLDWGLPPLPPAAGDGRSEKLTVVVVDCEDRATLPDNYQDPALAGLVPPRDPQATAKLIDLTDHYNTMLYKAWWTGDLPFGLQTLGGVQFDIRGQITVASLADRHEPNFKVPARVTGIALRQKVRVLHFLQGSSYIAAEGTQIGSYTIRYADHRAEKVPLIYGRNTRDFNALSDSRQTQDSLVVWSGGRVMGVSPRLFKFSWENPFPAVEIECLDFETSMTKSIPWLIAITAE